MISRTAMIRVLQLKYRKMRPTAPRVQRGMNTPEGTSGRRPLEADRDLSGWASPACRLASFYEWPNVMMVEAHQRAAPRTPSPRGAVQAWSGQGAYLIAWCADRFSVVGLAQP